MEINCKFFQNGLCLVEHANISQPGQLIAAFKGDYPQGMSNADIVILTFTAGPSVQYFPRDMIQHFPNLKVVHIVGSGIKEISKEDLRGLQNLVGFAMMHGQLKSLSEDLFTDMPNLKTISFEDNKIEVLSTNVLKPLLGNSGVTFVVCGNKNMKFDVVD